MFVVTILSFLYFFVSPFVTREYHPKVLEVLQVPEPVVAHF